MLSFLLTIYLAFAYNPYVRTLRRPHQATGGAAQQNPFMWGEMDYGDMIEDGLPFFSGMMRGASQGGQGTQSFASAISPFFSVYMNNPYGMNYQKCLDNDRCTAWVGHRMYMPDQGMNSGASKDTTTGTGATGTGATGTGADGADGAATGTGATGTGATGTGGATGGMTGGMNSFTPAMMGFPVGFNPQVYGLDWDAQMKDCIDDSKCARGLMMFTQGRNMGNAFGSFFGNMFMPSRLQRPRRLSRPRYGIPYRYGRQY